MAGFSFRFQKLMDLKDREKEDSKAKYSESLASLNKEQIELDELVQRIQQWEKKRAEMVMKALPAQLLLEVCSYIQHLEKLYLQKQKQVDKAEQRVSASHLQLTEKMRELRVWENWKNNSYKEFQHEALQREQKELDELALQRYVRRGGTIYGGNG
ncbi:flagellar export protein FliJ [Ammoniphilus sp. 3BR4]|uniref:flagellar export protein FliJ n=1 Tax=Ammoniphilus sp. 3BR4 TaxID=3158265 RepID=UPI003465F177